MLPKSDNLSNNDFKRLTLSAEDCKVVSVPMAICMVSFGMPRFSSWKVGKEKLMK